MTIQLLQPFNGLKPGIYSNLGAVEEARLVALPGGMARYYTDGMDGKNPVLSVTEQSAVQALVSGAGIGPLSIAAPDGTAAGDVLTATPNAGWTVATYQWTRDGVDISGETSSTYTLTLADEAALIGCVAGSPVYTARLEIPAGTYPSGYLSLSGDVLSLGSGVLSLA